MIYLPVKVSRERKQNREKESGDNSVSEKTFAGYGYVCRQKRQENLREVITAFVSEDLLDTDIL